MTADQPLTIRGWRPTGRAVVALGVAIAVGMGTIALTEDDSPRRLFASPFVAPAIGLLLAAAAVSAVVRWVLHRPRGHRLTRGSFALALITLANLVAVVLLGISTLGMLAIGDQRWPVFLQAVVLCTLLGFIIGLAQTIVSNVSAVKRVSPSPPSAPPP